jgi:hypothetical protein
MPGRNHRSSPLVEVKLFLAVLGASNDDFAGASLNRQVLDWITGHH